MCSITYTTKERYHRTCFPVLLIETGTLNVSLIEANFVSVAIQGTVFKFLIIQSCANGTFSKENNEFASATKYLVCKLHDFEIFSL